MKGSQFLATKAFSIGQNTFQFLISFAIMLYLLFFLLRDGREVAAAVRRAIPLGEIYKQHLLSKFTTVVKVTVKALRIVIDDSKACPLLQKVAVY